MRIQNLNILILLVFLSGVGCPAAQQAFNPAVSGGPAGAGAAGGESPARASEADAATSAEETVPQGPGAGNVPPPSNPTTGPVSDTPITIVNAPMANIPAAQTCVIADATLCFSDIVVEAAGTEDSRLKYQVTGTLNRKHNVTSTLTGVPAPIFLKDLDFDQPHFRGLAANSDNTGAFSFLFLAMPGHNVELMGPSCNRTAILDFETPEGGTPLNFNSCASSEPSDISTGTQPVHPKTDHVVTHEKGAK